MAKIIHINDIEVKGNKVTKIDSNSTNIEYPSAKAVYDMVSSLEPSDNNTLIEDTVEDWDTLYTVLRENDKVFATGGSVTVCTRNNLWGVSGFYNIKRDLNTSYEFIATNIVNPVGDIYRLNTQDKTYEFMGSIPFGSEESVIDREDLFSHEMIDKYLSLPVYTRSVAGDTTDKFYNSLTDQGIYKISSYSGVHEVLLVFKPNTNAHIMQIRLRYDKVEYRGAWSSVSDGYADEDWESWKDLTDKSFNVNEFNSITALGTDADPQIFAYQTNEPSSPPLIKFPLSLIMNKINTSLSDGDIDSDSLFSLDMQQKYLSYPKYQHFGSYGSISYDTLLDPGIYQVSNGTGVSEVVIVMAPPGMGGYGSDWGSGWNSGWNSDSDAYRFQIKLSHEKIEYRSCWATSSLESPEIGDWTDWSLLNSLIDMGMITDESGLVDKTYNSEVTYTFRSNGSWGLPTGNYMAKLAVNSNTILEVAPFIYRGKSYQIDTDDNNWSITEVTPT